MAENAHCTHDDWHFGRTVKTPTITASAAKTENKGLGSLKGHMHTMAMGTQANNCATTTKIITECVSRVCGNEMRQLVVSVKESTPTEPVQPDDTNATNKDKATWGKQCGLFLKQEVQCKDQKAKVFTIVCGQCDKAMKNQVEADSSHSSVESTTDVAKLLQLIEGVACDANEKKHPTQQATMALGGLMMP